MASGHASLFNGVSQEKKRVGGVWWGGSIEVVVVVVVVRWGALSSLLSAVLSPHRHIMRRIMNSATLGGWGKERGPLSLKTSPILNREGVGRGGGEGGDPIQKLILPGEASNAGTALYVGRIIGSSMSPSVCR